MTTGTLLHYTKNVAKPDLWKEFPNARVDIYNLGDRPVARWIFKPGFDLSRDLKPMMEKPPVECEHIGYVVRGRLEVRMGDGTRTELRPGDVCRLAGDHEARVLGNEPFEVIDFGDLGNLVEGLER